MILTWTFSYNFGIFHMTWHTYIERRSPNFPEVPPGLSCVSMCGLSGERIEKILLHNIFNEIFLQVFINHSWYSGQCSRLSCWRPGFNSLARQFFKLTFSPSSPSPPVIITKPSSFRLATFKITQIISPERASERKGMSTKERFIWVNLYSLDLNREIDSLLWNKFFAYVLNMKIGRDRVKSIKHIVNATNIKYVQWKLN